MCTAVLIGWGPATSPFRPHLDSYTRALLVSKYRGHLFVTPWLNLSWDRPFKSVDIGAVLVRLRLSFTFCAHAKGRNCKGTVLCCHGYEFGENLLGNSIRQTWFERVKHTFTHKLHESIDSSYRNTKWMMRWANGPRIARLAVQSIDWWKGPGAWAPQFPLPIS